MYAVIKTGGKQYKVAIGDKLKVEKLAAEEGASVELERVLMVADGENISLGSPLAETAVSATVLSHGRGGKIRVFKMKRRKDYRRTLGHRQAYTEIEITAIGGETGAKTAEKSASGTKTSAKKKTKTAPAKKKKKVTAKEAVGETSGEASSKTSSEAAKPAVKTVNPLEDNADGA